MLVEQLDKETGEVLRRYRSGTEAAASMQGNQVMISRSITGKQREAYGFVWRRYEGPPIADRKIRITVFPTA